MGDRHTSGYPGRFCLEVGDRYGGRKVTGRDFD